VARPATGRPTEGELEILQVLWDRGAGTVRQVHGVVRRRRRCGFTSTLKLMQIMLVKGLLRRDESRRPQVYQAAVARARVQRKFLRHLLRRLFGGSANLMVARLLDASDLTREELAELDRLIAAHARKKEPG
jgi:predicted transcriptional regulator